METWVTRFHISCLWLLILVYFFADVNEIVAQGSQCELDELRCPNSKACFERYQICDTYDDCGTGFDEIECLAPPSDLCQPVTGNSSRFRDVCTRFTGRVGPHSSNEGVERPATDGTLYFNGPPDKNTVMDQVYFSPVDFEVIEYAYMKVVVTPFSSVTNVTMESITLVVANGIDWTESDASITFPISLRSPIRVDPAMADSIRLDVSYVADAIPDQSNPYRSPTFLRTTSFLLHYRSYRGQCASSLDEVRPNPCLETARYYAVTSYMAAERSIYCEARERVQVVYDIYSACFVETPLPIQPWQLLGSSSTTASAVSPTTEVTTTRPAIAPPCEEGKLVCPVSRACFERDDICDSYDDCGTDYEEQECPFLPECREVELQASLIDIWCVDLRPTARYTTLDPERGVFLYPIPEGQDSFIVSLTIETALFAPGLLGILYAMFNITTVDQIGSPPNTTIITAEFPVTDKGSFAQEFHLRAPMPVYQLETKRIELSVLRTPDANPPGPLNPYEVVYPNQEAINMNFIQYRGNCGALPDELVGTECLQATWDFARATEKASSMGLTCLPPERTRVYADLYAHCYEAPTIVRISRNLTGLVPGGEVTLECASTGTPFPVVRWEIPDMPEGLEIRNGSYQSSSASVAELSFTTATDTAYRFECVAESYVGQVRATSTVTTLGDVCANKIMARDRFQAASHLNQTCPSVHETRIRYSANPRELVFSLPSTGLLYHIDLPSYIFSSDFGNSIAALQISITVDSFRGVPQRRRRRDIVPILYERVFSDLTEDRNASVYRVYFRGRVPISVSASENFYVRYMTLDGSGSLTSPDGPINLKYLQCAELVDRVHNESCYRVYEQWREMEKELIELGCEERTSWHFDLYQNCLGIANENMTELQLSIPVVKLYNNYTLNCPISGSIQSHWVRKTSRFDILPFEKPSSVLQFDSFNSFDQAYYFCVGIGSNNQTLVTDPVLLAFRDITTLGFSITFNRTFIDLDDPLFLSEAFNIQFSVRSALVANPVLENLLVGGRMGFNGYDVPFIDNVRNGSLIVDFQASFAGDNGTDLIETVASTLRDNLRNDTSLPDVLLDSITVGSVSSCAESVYTGSEGTFTFPSIGLDQISDSVEHCASYTGNIPVPRATRRCSGDFFTPASWDNPTFSECFNEDDNTDELLQDIANAPVSPQNVTSYSNDLAMVTNQTSSITADGLVSIAISLENIVQVQDSSEEVTVNVITTVNNVLRVADEDFIMAIDAEAPTRILDSLEEQVTLFQTQGDGSNLTVVEESVAVIALNIPSSTLQQGLGFAAQGGVGVDGDAYNDVLVENQTMVFFDTEEIPMTEFEAAIVIPSGILDLISFSSSGGGMVPVSFFVFQNSRLFQSGNQQNTLESGRRQAVGSRIIAATIEGFNVQNLPPGQEIETAFLELNVTDDGETVDARSCVFWEKISSGGRWSTEGCRREDLPGLGRIRCLCDHLTSFAVLLDVSGNINVFALDIFSMIGCGVSSLCLVILLITYLSVKKLRSRQPQRIHINLCIALLGLYVAFLVGIDLRYPTIGCVAAGFIIHFFLLSSMAWMLVEAVYMYLLFVRIHSGTVSKYLRTSVVLAWGSPLIICIVLVFVDQEFYLGDGTYCFVQPGSALYYGVLLPVALILLINSVIFILVTYRLTCGRWKIAENKNIGDNSNKRSQAWRQLQDLIAFTILLGLTWVFGFLAIGEARFVFNVLFLVFNSLQGLFVFIMFGLRQKPVRDEWLRCLRCRCCEDESSRRSQQYMKSKPVSAQVSGSSGLTRSTAGSDIPLDGRVSTNTASTVT